MSQELRHATNRLILATADLANRLERYYPETAPLVAVLRREIARAMVALVASRTAEVERRSAS